jgi:hypothetical protein
MGPYPLFACRDWSQLGDDLEELNDELVSLTVVTDPFGGYDVSDLRECFRDVVTPFKQHFVVKLDRPLDAFVHPHHLRYARKARRVVQVEKLEDATSARPWMALMRLDRETQHHGN